MVAAGAVGAAGALRVTGEQWRPVVGWEGFYEVSSLGRFKSVARTVSDVGKGGTPRQRYYPEHISEPRSTKFGYPCVSLSRAGKTRGQYLHILVCEAFHGPRPAGHLVAHNDGRVENCKADNLRWATPKQNHADMVRHGTRRNGERAVGAKLTEAVAAEIRSIRGLSHRELAARFGISKSRVQAVRSGACWCADDAGPVPEDRRYKLSQRDVAEIRATRPEISNAALAAEYGVSKTHISGIRCGSQRPRG